MTRALVGKLAAADAAYRRALGLPADAPLPNALGASASSGAARGGRGRSLSKQAKNRRRRKGNA